jgi:hypothetical protein
MPLTDQVLQPNSLRVDGAFIHLSLGLPWFRSLPLASIEFDELAIDGRVIELSSVSANISGSWEQLSWSPSVANKEWFVQDRLELRIPYKDSPQLEFDVAIKLRVVTPNLFHAPGRPIEVPQLISGRLKPVR